MGFFGDFYDATRAGYTTEPCAWCGGWVWWPPEHERTEATIRAGRVFHDFKLCERREREARTYAVELANKIVGGRNVANEWSVTQSPIGRGGFLVKFATREEAQAWIVARVKEAVTK